MLIMVGLVVLASTAPRAQHMPDLSGQWVLESLAPPVSDMPRALSIRQSLVRTNVRGEAVKPFFKDITIDREFESGTRTETFLIGVVGGKDPGTRVDGSPDGPYTRTAVVWEGNTLAIERGSHTGPTPETGVWTERREVWSLKGADRLLVAVTSRSSVDDPKTVTLTYRRERPTR
jgi:hypothetical protein